MKALVLFSGGVDSTTCLAMAIDKYSRQNVAALSISYGQKHKKEIEAAKKIAAFYGVEQFFLDLKDIFNLSDCSLLEHSNKEIPLKSYSEQMEKSSGPVSTYVPFRNGLFLSAAASVALSKGCEAVYYGAHGDDAAGNAYPDCTAEFNEAMGIAIFEGSGKKLILEAPFIGKSKAEVVRVGLKLNVPYNLTWSCYQGLDKPCGKCATCLDRKAAFLANSICED